MRQIVLDTETTGIDPNQGHRVIEIGGVEMVGRKLTGRTFHVYLNPDREIDAEAIEVHGITNDFLADKPRFADVAQDFFEFIRGAQLVIHNAPFDVGFINNEYALYESQQGSMGFGQVDQHCTVLDTLVMAREMHPGARNNLDALCKRYDIDNSNRELHGALLDAEILSDVYLAMTGGQTALMLDNETFDDDHNGAEQAAGGIHRLNRDRPALAIVRASTEELAAHDQKLATVAKASGGDVMWLSETPLH
ncbi:DNA polymerase III subunit epsilon [Terasakiispira papahanaumokuakeensis]|uniref:DNA polymerase III subunit epsilon n=1 Tax=Terasakiispira papahanaumokuakeensis TaxID=197479 RepID=A0A1E2V7P8_9GAMM|nr:DNA polymerase III subunit epsilon [Terasakiispira papahanaumokuakeensis]ODC02943.1 DNA polymerase III subunit epsilon [Terasakiispira papahanaumokuakeensis]